MGVRIRIKRQDNNLITRGQRTEVRIHLKTREIERCKDTKIKREQQMEESISKLYCCLSLHMNFFLVPLQPQDFNLGEVTSTEVILTWR